MGQDQSPAKRLDHVTALLTANGWPDWLDSTFVDASGATVQLRPDASAQARAEVERLALAHDLRVTVGETHMSWDAGKG